MGSGRSMSQIVPEIDPKTPLRLDVAAKIAFPNGGMTVSGLRREIAKGRLAVEVIAGKQFTTLADIQEMRSLCRAKARVPDFNCDPREETSAVSLATKPHGSSEMAGVMSSRDALKAKLRRLNGR
jgi:hypothetical protein